MNNEIEKLVNKLNEYRYKYYNNSSEINDEEFDYYENKLKQLDPTNPYFKQVGAKLEKDDEEVEHVLPMLSMQKVQTSEAAEKWYNTLAKQFGKIVWVDPKLDGISGKLVYDKNGDFVYASTRGDGLVGAKIKFADKMNIPKKCIPNCELNGEFIINKKWQTYFNTSLRNMCSGILKRKEPSEDLKYISFVIYNIRTYDSEFEFNNRGDKINKIKSILDNLNQHYDIIPLNKTDNVTEMYNLYVNKLRDEWEYETDGIILTVDGDQSIYDLINSKYKITTFNRYNMAVKPPANFAESEITDIKVKVNRQKVSFVASLKPVQLLNVVVSNATLDNYTNMVTNKIGIGTTVLVKRTNDVIPKVYNFYNNPSKDIKYLDITHCPSCGSKLVQVYQDVMCPNEFGCMAIYESKISNIISKFEILGIGESIIKGICEIIDKYKDKSIGYTLTLFDFFAGFMPLSDGSYKYEKDIEEMFNGGVRPKNFKAAMFNFFNNNLTESKLISCFNIPYIGETSLVEHNIRSLQQLRNYIDELENKVVLESVFDSTLFKWWKHNKIGREDMICCVELLKQFFKTEEEITSDTHLYCISGPVPDFYGNKNTYATAISDINSNYKYVKDVTSSIEYLVTTETNTSKVIKAHKYGVKIVDFDEFMKICKK